jgi:hypothetical protein
MKKYGASMCQFSCSLPVSSEAAGVVSIARIERPPLVRLSLEGELESLPLRVSNEGLLVPPL